ncbi:SusC/RagA family TonB-linked outer membrane protein [Pseudochryseolinea flava]|nr:TonB-dependent receptor [Pseudochryseolinea flava]
MVRFLLFILFGMTIFHAHSQSRRITGSVKDGQDGSPIPGANVVVQGTSKGTTTDLDGNFAIDLSDTESVLNFSFVGYKTSTVEVGDRTVVDVTLEADITMLADVVVVGYGIQKKTDITGATASVKGEELSKQPVLTATQAMQGKVAGVQIISSGQPGTSPQVRIRGLSTALGGTTTLFVVDGVLTDDISNINTADIVSMDVLKDASSAAIYGSRGANGVIIITTRQGKAGAFKINYNNNIGIRQASNLVEMANAEEYRNYVQAATGEIVPQSDYDTDWYDTILRTALQQSHNISLSGGTDKSTFLINAGYLEDEGIVIGNEFKRLTLRLNSDYKINDKVTLGLQSSYGSSENQNGFNNIDIDAFGNIGAVYNNAYRASPTIASKVGGRYGNTSAFQNVGNPLLDVSNNRVKVLENRLQGSSFLEVKPTSWLSLRTSIGADWKNSLNRVYAYEFRADENTFLIAGGNQLNPLSRLNVKQIQSFRWVWDNTATITKSFDKHAFTLLIGTTAEKYKQHWISALRKDVPPDENLWYINVGDANTSQNDGKGEAWSRNSYLARLNYAFDEKYLLTATIRTDGSSRLPGKNRWQQYPSFGVGWIASREAFMLDQNIFDLLKLRASYGKVGNDQVPTDAYTSIVTLNTPYAFNGSVSPATNGAQLKQLIDPNLTWESTTEYDVALEFEMLNSRLSGEVNYYNKKVDNALIKVPIFNTIGDDDNAIITNVASIQNKGVEVVLNWKGEINTKLSYTIGANATFNKNEVVALNGGQAIWGGSVGAAQGFTTYTDNGQPVGSFYVLKVLGVFNTDAEVNAYVNDEGEKIQPTAKPGTFKYLDKNGDGTIDDSDRVFAGSYQPKAYFGLNLGVNYKNWDFALSIYGNVGNEVYNGKKGVRIDGKDNIERDMVYNRWTSGSRSQTEPAANTGNLLASDYFIESGSFARINNLTIGYTLRPTLLERVRINSLRVFVMSQNLLTYKKYSGFTAELPGDPTNSGIELSAYPTTRTISAGVNISF